MQLPQHSLGRVSSSVAESGMWVFYLEEQIMRVLNSWRTDSFLCLLYSKADKHRCHPNIKSKKLLISITVMLLLLANQDMRFYRCSCMHELSSVLYAKFCSQTMQTWQTNLLPSILLVPWCLFATYNILTFLTEASCILQDT